MYLLIPLGGLGIRFKKMNYERPKPLIKVFGKEIIFWLLDNLNLNNITGIFVPYNKELKHYNFEDILRKRYPNLNFYFFCLEKNTDGAIETILLCLNNFKPQDKPILLLDGDNFYTTNIINMWNGTNSIFAFEDKSEEPLYSYIEVNEYNKILRIIEKEKISNLACTGAYGFNSVNNLKIYCEYILENNVRMKNEFYTSIAIDLMIKKGVDFYSKIINSKNYICLGTPLQVRLFCNNYPKINSLTNEQMIKPLRFCFDLDNTLVTYPTIPNDYSTVKPIQKNIDFLKYLKKFGNTIIIYTARKMKSSGSNIGLVNKNIGKITFDTLEKFDIPFDEIYFGKPYADFYIDDLAINAYQSLEKESGFYKDNIDPRDFNSITKTSLEIIKKESKNSLDGEIYYYLNIPSEIKDMFPILFDYDNIGYNWYNLEYISGIPVSKLFLSEQLNPTQFENILNSIDRIHNVYQNSNSNSNQNSHQINIYENYSIKLKKRFEEYDYSIFDGYLEIYLDIIEKLEDYEKRDLGKFGVIHGDPVFPNIIINKHEKIKFIDMRGKINSTLTIYGDKIYDWAKFYQSLIGYDEILDDKILNQEYTNVLISTFEKKITLLYGKEYLMHIRNITKSLLFSLIPLHNNNNCIKFFNLIKKI
jgi:capsule biosynthesis phosphatase